MRYVGRHRAPRPLYLRRPVIGGVAVVLLLSGPALAISNGAFGNGAEKGALPDASTTTSPAVLVPTDDTVVPTTEESSTPPETTGSSTPPATTGGGTVPNTTAPHTTGGGTGGNDDDDDTPKPPAYVAVKLSGVSGGGGTVAPGDTVTVSAKASKGTGTYTYAVNVNWLTGGGKSGTFSGKVPDDADDGKVTITIVVTDGKKTASSSTSVTVKAPVIVDPPVDPDPADPA